MKGIIIDDRGVNSTIEISPDAAFSDKVEIRIQGRDNILRVAPGADLGRSKIHIRGRRCVIDIGPDCRFKQGTLSVQNDDSSVSIGAGTTWESGQIIAQQGCRIAVGKDCMFSHDIMIRTSDSHGIFDLASKDLINPPNNVLIGDHVWIGNSARVNKGVIIGSGSVLAQMSITSSNVDRNCIYGGVPSKKLRGNVTWSRTQVFTDIPEEFVISEPAGLSRRQGVLSTFMAWAQELLISLRSATKS